MDRLPPEIVSEVVGTLALNAPRNLKLSSYACISRAWQSAIEQHTFHEIFFNIDELDKFKKLFESNNVGRARYLTRLFVKVSRDYHAAKDQDDTAWFSTSVVNLFIVLGDLHKRAENLPPLLLRFYGENKSGEKPFDLKSPDQVLPVEQVSRFWFSPSGNLVSLRPGAVFKILEKLPKAEIAYLGFLDNIEWGRRKRRAQREGESPLVSILML
jgi:hypothetical protein